MSASCVLRTADPLVEAVATATRDRTRPRPLLFSDLPFPPLLPGTTDLQGKALPVAAAAKLTQPTCPVIVLCDAGDNTLLRERAFLRSAQTDLALTCILVGDRSSVPRPPVFSLEAAINIPLLALCAGASWIAQGSLDHPDDLASLLRGALDHPGFSVLSLLPPFHTPSRETPPHHDTTDLPQALTLIVTQDTAYRGLLYHRPEKTRRSAETLHIAWTPEQTPTTS